MAIPKPGIPKISKVRNAGIIRLQPRRISRLKFSQFLVWSSKKRVLLMNLSLRLRCSIPVSRESVVGKQQCPAFEIECWSWPKFHLFIGILTSYVMKLKDMKIWYRPNGNNYYMYNNTVYRCGGALNRIGAPIIINLVPGRVARESTARLVIAFYQRFIFWTWVRPTV